MNKVKNIKSANTFTNADEISKQESGEILAKADIIGTPFQAIKMDNGEVKANFVAWGANRISDFMTDEEITKKVHEMEAGKIDWNIAGAMAACIAINIINDKSE